MKYIKGRMDFDDIRRKHSYRWKRTVDILNTIKYISIDVPTY